MIDLFAPRASAFRSWGPGRSGWIWSVGLAALFLAAHLAFFPPTLEDIDSTNFALGLHDFDPARHQPHPPGYPIFIALGKMARIVSSDVTALAVWGAIFGALAVWPLLTLFGALESRGRAPDAIGLQRARLATVLALTCPLVWFTALRPMSDIPGLTAALVAQACLVSAFVRQRESGNSTPADMAASGRLIVLGALAAGLAMGIRSQAIWLTAPMLMLVLVHRSGRGAAGALLGAMMSFTIGVLIWAVPLLIASGGLARYRAALAAQAGEDLAGVDMLLTNPTPRRLALSLVHTFLYPWASTALGVVVVALGVIGLIALVRRSPMSALLLIILAGPYALFHLIFQETLTVRYALPLMPGVSYLAVRGAAALGRRACAGIVAALVVWGLALTLPAAAVYSTEPSPTFAALQDLERVVGATPNAVLGFHQGFERSVQMGTIDRMRVLPAPPMREWLELTKYWRGGNRDPIWFLADPARTDLELIDPLSRHILRQYVWSFPRLSFMGGVRPDIVDLVKIDSPPGWFCEEGWHLTSETLNLSERQSRSEAVAYLRSRPGPAVLVIGGEGLGGSGAIFSATIDGRLVDEWSIPAGGTFFRRTSLPAGAVESSSTFARLVVSYRAPEAGKSARVRLTQFAVQSPADVFAVQQAGWHEIEYSRELQRRWRWIADRAVAFVNNGGRDVTLTIAGESPLRYFDGPSEIVVRTGDRILLRETPTADFEWTVKVPAAALEAGDGALVIETSQTFIPAERSRSLDRRRLGVRIFNFDVR